jgi:hypothetical protein
MSLNADHRSELRIQREILQAEDNLVLWIESALDKCEYGGQKSNNGSQKSQEKEQLDTKLVEIKNGGEVKIPLPRKLFKILMAIFA